MNEKTNSSEISDQLCSNNFFITNYDVKVFYTSIDHHLHLIDDYWNLLNFSEKESALKYQLGNPRNSKIISLALLKKLLGYFLDIEPSTIKLEYSIYGKPFLIINNHLDISFNLSHSENKLLFGFTRNAQIGVDIECRKDINDINAIMNMCFTINEIENYRSSKSENQLNYFYSLWTIKEAFIKAIGMGLSFPPENIEIIFDKENKPRISTILSNSLHLTDYKIFNTPISDEYYSAIIVNSYKKNIDYLSLESLMNI